MEKQISIIGNAVINGITVSGKFGSNVYTTCDLMEQSLETLNALYVSLSDIRAKIEGKSLLKKDSQTKDLDDKIALVEAIFEIKKATAEQKAAEAKERKLRANKLAALSEIKSKKEVANLESMSLEDIEKQIAELEAV